MDRIEKILAEGTAVDEAMRRGVQEALRRHRLLGLPIAVWRDGKVVWIPSEEIPIAEEPGNGSGTAGE